MDFSEHFTPGVQSRHECHIHRHAARIRGHRVALLLDGARIAQLAADNTISRSTGYTCLYEGLTLIAGEDDVSVWFTTTDKGFEFYQEQRRSAW